MILVDTSIWADHIRRPEAPLASLLTVGRVVMHPYVTGELSLGNPPDRTATLARLARLPQLTVAFPAEILMFIERHALGGTGIGYVDAHLLAAVMLTDGALLWTRDRRLHAQASRLDVAWTAGER